MTAYYQAQVDAASLELSRLQQKNNWFSALRLGVFAAFTAICILVLAYADWYALIPFVIFLFVFSVVIRAHDKIKTRTQYLELLKEINIQELDVLNGNISAFDGGAAYIDAAHAYTSDLDIFGERSVFQLLNRTTSTRGADLLASWLKTAAPDQEILLRQEAVKELNPLVAWRQHFRVMGKLHAGSGKDLESFFSWLKEPATARVPGRLALAIYILPFILLGSLIYICFQYHPGIPLLLLMIQILLVRRWNDRAASLHAQISRFSAIILSYSGLIACVEETAFHSILLSGLRKQILETTEISQPASVSLKALSAVLARFDIREIPVFHLVLNYLSFWDLKQMIRLEKWKQQHKAFIPGWIDSITFFEAASSLANCSYNEPGWAWPVLQAEYFYLQAKDAAHPLIRKDSRVSNSLEIDGAGKVILITGSNMSGKSTFLRTLGVNAVLAMAGSPVCALEFTFSSCQVYTSLRIMDSLSEGTSSFYAELKRLENLIILSREGKPVFFLLDEILRGTNSVDRFTGSAALIKQFIKNNTSGILASHDLALAELDQSLPSLANYSFDVQVSGSELYFDYTLHAGKCTSLNASILMKKIGIDLED